MGLKQVHLMIDELLLEKIKRTGWRYAYIFQKGFEAISGQKQGNEDIKANSEAIEKLSVVNKNLERALWKTQEELIKLKGDDKNG